jgi:sugar lactone lactonase YvrE
VRRVDAKSGIIRTVAGGGKIPALANHADHSQLSDPLSVWGDTMNNLYIVESGKERILKLSLEDNSLQVAVQLPCNHVWGDTNGKLFITQTGLHQVSAWSGKLSTIQRLAGNGTEGFRGDNGPAIAALLNTPLSTWGDSLGNLYVVDGHNFRIRKIDRRTKIITSIAGNGEGYTNGGHHNPFPISALSTSLIRPSFLTGDSDGDLFVLDFDMIRIISPNHSTTLRISSNSLSFESFQLPTADSLHSLNVVSTLTLLNLALVIFLLVLNVIYCATFCRSSRAK